MKIYIAAKYHKRHDLRPLAETLERLGHKLTCRWLWDGEEGKSIQEAATMDVQDVLRADCLIFIGEPQASENRGGGRWFEFGLAYGIMKRCIALLDMDPTVGGHSHLPIGHESVFTALQDVQVVRSEDELLDVLKDIPEDINTEYANDLPSNYVKQEGGDHYQSTYEHWDWVQEAGIGYLVGNATKYLVRWRKKNGVQDLLKARTYLEKIIATRHLPGADWHYREGSYRTRITTERFIEVNRIPHEEANIIWTLTGPCSVGFVGMAIDNLDNLIRSAQNPNSGIRPTPPS